MGYCCTISDEEYFVIGDIIFFGSITRYFSIKSNKSNELISHFINKMFHMISSQQVLSIRSVWQLVYIISIHKKPSWLVKVIKKMPKLLARNKNYFHVQSEVARFLIFVLRSKNNGHFVDSFELVHIFIFCSKLFTISLQYIAQTILNLLLTIY